MADRREELVRYYAALRRHGLNDSHSGNGSVRDGGTVWITPTGAPAERLRPDELVACRLPDDVGPGASLDACLHLSVYRENRGAGAVLHAHNPHAITLTLDGKAFTPLDAEGRLYFGEVPVLTLERDHYWSRHREEAPIRVARVLACHPACILGDHGVYVQGRDLDEAYKWLCSLEHSARIAWLRRVASRK